MNTQGYRRVASEKIHRTRKKRHSGIQWRPQVPVNLAVRSYPITGAAAEKQGT